MTSALWHRSRCGTLRERRGSSEWCHWCWWPAKRERDELRRVARAIMVAERLRARGEIVAAVEELRAIDES